MLPRIRENLALALVGLLPLHALLVTVGTRIFIGPGQSAFWGFRIWKEAFLAIICCIALWEIGQRIFKRERIPRIDHIDLCIIVLMLIAVFVTAGTHGNFKLFIYGWKYDFLAPSAFLILRRVSWSDVFVQSVHRIVVSIGGAIAAYGLITLIIPQSFFTWIGYSDMHSLFFPGKPIAAFQYISEMNIRRMQSTMSGPNQLGIWLLIPLGFALIQFLRCQQENSTLLRKVTRFLPGTDNKEECLSLVLLGMICAAIALTFSRSAWIATVVISVVATYWQFGREQYQKVVIRFGAVFLFLLCIVLLLYPSIILRISSSRGHLIRPGQAAYVMIEDPFGRGLGSAGPASSRVTDTCVHLRPQDDPSWAKGRDDLCVFLGATQVQPSNRQCKCPFLPENWYLQIGVELGVIGFILYIVFIVLLLTNLFSYVRDVFSQVVFLSIIGVSVAGMFLHSWEDAAVAYTLWVLVAVVFSRNSMELKYE